VKVLRKFARDIRKRIPVDPVASSKASWSGPLSSKRYEDAARLRDQINELVRAEKWGRNLSPPAVSIRLSQSGPERRARYCFGAGMSRGASRDLWSRPAEDSPALKRRGRVGRWGFIRTDLRNGGCTNRLFV